MSGGRRSGNGTRRNGDGDGGRHLPVMLDEAMTALAVRPGGAYVDGTFGAGGYTRAILDRDAAVVYAIDRDPEAVTRARAMAGDFPGKACRIVVLPGRFSGMDHLLAEAGAGPVQGVVLDLGISSFQLDTPGRGFSFREDGPLDMRMEDTGSSAADLVNKLSIQELAGLIRSLGEERFAGRIARAIVEAREEAPVLRTGRLAEIVRAAVPAGPRRIDPATRTFLALRLRVNNELEELESGLAAAERVLAPGGRLAVVSFHSLEDRRVKTFLRDRSDGRRGVSRHQPLPAAASEQSFRLLGRRAIRPMASEITFNPRARSARLRAAERIDESITRATPEGAREGAA